MWCDALRDWLLRKHEYLYLWGEAAIPSFIVFWFFLRKNEATLRPDLELSALLRVVISTNQPRSASALANPYYGFEDVARHGFGFDAASASSKFSQETFSGSSFFAETLLHLLVRTNLKSHCRQHWPDFNRIGHIKSIPSASWQYCLTKIREGIEETRLYPSGYDWDTLRNEAAISTWTYVPGYLLDRPLLAVMWWFVAPYRATSDAVRAVASKLVPGWPG
jgi:hypothetical protein